LDFKKEKATGSYRKLRNSKFHDVSLY